MTVDPNATTLQPRGNGHVLLALCILFPILSTLVVGLRCWVRAKHRVFGLDDGVMLLGWMFFMATCGILARSTYAGVGAADDRLNAHMVSDSKRFLFYFEVVYCSSLLFIKGSICITLLRIATQRIHRLIVWATLIFTELSTLTVVIGLFCLCRPLSAFWGEPGTCVSPIVITALAYLISIGAVIADWSCAILPGFILWKTQMKLATKISVSFVLALGVLASIITIVRLPTLRYYDIEKNYLENYAEICYWSVVEAGIAIIGGSIPALRRLISQRFQMDMSKEHSVTQNTAQYGVFSRDHGTGTNLTSTKRTRRGVSSTVTGEGDWNQLDDAGSTRKIYIETDTEMQYTAPESHKSHDSAEDLFQRDSSH
ncbi:hypothetical protein FSARC_12643 [Fusarium sarcochroum]|uniref:Rhodopsin domain-containing protein n=1 Tax=Fusarium sarcochroum TaxID=1208366 RepID=A0A8H4T738_9HYPO|nr:hypothetical protein FSARC_12643 [Fusarium sarcochroum]